MSDIYAYNWYDLDRTSLCSYIYSMNGAIVGRTLTPNQIHRALSKHIKDMLPIKIKKHIDANITRGYIYTGGVYHSDDDKKGRTAIEVNFSYHPDDAKLTMTNYKFRKLSRRITDVVLHELIHMRQFRARNFKSIPNYQSTAEFSEDKKQQEYFGDTDEMGAFSFNIACELIDRFGYCPSIIKQYLDSNGASRHKNSWWYSYLNYFDWNHNHKIIRRMKRKIMKHLDNAYIGKPYKTTTWIS